MFSIIAFALLCLVAVAAARTGDAAYERGVAQARVAIEKVRARRDALQVKESALAAAAAAAAATPNFGALNKIKLNAKIQPLKSSHVVSGNQDEIDAAPGNNDLECALCGIAVNEVFGLLDEERTDQELVHEIQTKVCSHFEGALEALCDVIATGVPLFAHQMTKSNVSNICIDLTLCNKPLGEGTDLMPVPKVTLNLDDLPSKRWTAICAQPVFKANMKRMIALMQGLFSHVDGTAIGNDLLTKYYPTVYAQEIEGCANGAGVSPPLVALLNLGYEASDACTSIVAQSASGEIMHARNLDFFLGQVLTDLLRNLTAQVDVQSGGQTKYTMTSFVGMAGVLSAFKPNAFALTINTRFQKSLMDFLGEIWRVLQSGANTNFVTFLARDALETTSNFAAAVTMLQTTPLVCDVYYTVSGVKPGEGIIIARNATGPHEQYRLNAAQGAWYVLVTNWDHSVEVPWFDADRRFIANLEMSKLSPSTVSPAKLLGVLGVVPVKNMQTTYSITAQPANASSYVTYKRWCDFPCPD